MAFETTSAGNRTVTAYFEDRTAADNAVARLISAGVSRNDVRLVQGQQPGGGGGASMANTSSDQGGFLDALKDLFMPDEDRHTYAEGLRRGGYLVTVTAGTTDYDRVLDILDDEGTVDIGERESSWRSDGWAGYSGGSTGGLAGGASSMSGSGAAASSLGMTGGLSGSTGMTGTSKGTADTSERGSPGARSDAEVIPVGEEELRIGKRDVSHGRVRVRSYVVETPVTESVNLREENVHVERRPVDRPASAADEVLFQDRTIELEERAEEAVVAKEARVREELVINKEVGERTQTVSDTVRRTEGRDRGRADRSEPKRA
jgi:uncharacterized protein (TIGR02271 family)